MKTICPYCNYNATGHKTLDEETNPTSDDISFCINCGELSVFEKKVLVKVDYQTLHQTLPKETREEINDIRVAWLRRRAMDSVSGGVEPR